MLPVHSLFQNEWLTFVVFALTIFLLIGLSELTRSRVGWAPEGSRRFVHISVGVLILLCPFLFESKYPPVALAAVFMVVNSLALKSRKLAAMHSTQRKTFGTVYFPLAFLFLVLLWWERTVTLEISLLLLTFADTAAAMAGERVRSPEIYVVWQDQKSVQGSVVMFVSSTLLVGFGTMALHQIGNMVPPDPGVLLPQALFVAGLATVAEAVSKAGSDNLSVPLVAAVGYDLFSAHASNGEILVLLGWILFSFLLALGAFRLNALATDGALGAFVLGIFVFGIGRWQFMVPLGAFFILSSLLSHVGRERKEAVRTSFGKGSKRDVVQVYANGGIPLLIAIWWFYSPADWLYLAYLAGIAAATADTWGTEIGFFSKSAPRQIVAFKRVTPGASGGMTILGTVGSLVGSCVIAATALPFTPDQDLLITVAMAGFGASVVDSILGATIQAAFKCSACGEMTELPTHCDTEATLVRGIRPITNDVVNLICTLCGASAVFVSML